MNRKFFNSVALVVFAAPILARAQTTEEIDKQRMADHERLRQLETDIQKDYQSLHLAAGKKKEAEYLDLITKEYPVPKAPAKESKSCQALLDTMNSTSSKSCQNLFNPPSKKDKLGLPTDAKNYERGGATGSNGGLK